MIRAATGTDLGAIGAVAAAFGFDDADSGVDPGYLRLVMSVGRLGVVDHDGAVAGFAAMVPVGDAAMVADLFVLPELQGRGLGGALLRFVTDGYAQRMTFSSRQERAVPTYRRVGMEPQWVLRYLRGEAVRGASPVTARDVTSTTGASAARWPTDRPELAAHWVSRQGRVFVLDLDGAAVGHALVVPTRRGWAVHRLCSTAPHEQAVVAVLAVLEPGVGVELCVPEWSAAVPALARLGFVEADSDVHCATSDLLARSTVALHPGLA